MSRLNTDRLDDPAHLDQMDQQSLRAILARAESLSEMARRLLASATPAAAPQKAETPAQRSGSPPASLDTDATDCPANVDSAPATDAEAEKTQTTQTQTPAAASPAPTDDDDVPAMTQGEKTPVQADQLSPAAPPLPLLEESRAPGSEGSLLPATPTKVAAVGLAGEEPIVVEEEEAEAHGGCGAKGLGEEGVVEI